MSSITPIRFRRIMRRIQAFLMVGMLLGVMFIWGSVNQYLT